jgi:hypothetical protein
MVIDFILPCFEFRNSRENMEGEGEEPVGELLDILDALRAVTKLNQGCRRAAAFTGCTPRYNK